METITRKCGRCGTVVDLTNYINETKTCIICSEKAKVNYAKNRDVMVQRSRDYRLNNLEKEKERQHMIVIIKYNTKNICKSINVSSITAHCVYILLNYIKKTTTL